MSHTAKTTFGEQKNKFDVEQLNRVLDDVYIGTDTLDALAEACTASITLTQDNSTLTMFRLTVGGLPTYVLVVETADGNLSIHRAARTTWAAMAARGGTSYHRPGVPANVVHAAVKARAPRSDHVRLGVFQAVREYGGPEEGGWWFDLWRRVPDTLAVSVSRSDRSARSKAEKFLSELYPGSRVLGFVNSLPAAHAERPYGYS